MTLDDAVIAAIERCQERSERVFLADVLAEALGTYTDWTDDPETLVVRAMTRGRIAKRIAFDPRRGWFKVGTSLRALRRRRRELRDQAQRAALIRRARAPRVSVDFPSMRTFESRNAIVYVFGALGIALDRHGCFLGVGVGHDDLVPRRGQRRARLEAV